MPTSKMSSATDLCQPSAQVKLPCHPLGDIKLKHEDTWNIQRIGWGKKNENNTIETDPEQGSVLCVAFPKGSLNPSSAPTRPLGGLGFYASPKSIFPAEDVELRYKLWV